MAQTDSAVPPELLQHPYEKPAERVLRQVWNRLNQKNEHFVMAIVGREGSGKSHTAIKIASLIDEQFDHEQVFFRAESFLKLLRDEEFHPGGVYVIDEAGVSFGRRTWQDRAQVQANQALQLIRSHNVGLIFTLPRIGELDTQTEGRLQAFYEIQNKRPGEYVDGKWFWVDPDRTGTTGKIYRKYPRTNSGDRVTSIKFSPPDPDHVEPYEDRKRSFQSEMYDDAIEALSDDEGDEDEMTTDEIAGEILDDPDQFIKTINNGAQTVLDRNRIEREYDIGARRSKRVKSQVIDELDRDLL